MAQPKRRWSKRRTKLRRATWELKETTKGTCPHCHESVLPHTVCSNCGYYKGKEVIMKKASNED